MTHYSLFQLSVPILVKPPNNISSKLFPYRPVHHLTQKKVIDSLKPRVPAAWVAGSKLDEGLLVVVFFRSWPYFQS